MDDVMLGRPVSIKGRTSRSPLLPVSSPACASGSFTGISRPSSILLVPGAHFTPARPLSHPPRWAGAHRIGEV
jgi:hypothetical protein